MKIHTAWKEYRYGKSINHVTVVVEDSIVIDLVEGAVKAAEEKNHSWILQGFPRTKVQALALQKMGIIPDKFMLLKIKP